MCITPLIVWWFLWKHSEEAALIIFKKCIKRGEWGEANKLQQGIVEQWGLYKTCSKQVYPGWTLPFRDNELLEQSVPTIQRNNKVVHCFIDVSGDTLLLAVLGQCRPGRHTPFPLHRVADIVSAGLGDSGVVDNFRLRWRRGCGKSFWLLRSIKTCKHTKTFNRELSQARIQHCAFSTIDSKVTLR